MMSPSASTRSPFARARGCGLDTNGKLKPGVSVSIDAAANYLGTATATVKMSPVLVGSATTLNPMVRTDPTTQKLTVYLRVVVIR